MAYRSWERDIAGEQRSGELAFVEAISVRLDSDKFKKCYAVESTPARATVD